MRTQRIKNGILFIIIFFLVLAVFVLWHTLFASKQTAQETTLISAPVVRVGVAHPFLANLIKEIGGAYVSVVSIKEPSSSLEDSSKICNESVLFFGLTDTTDGWIKELCGTENDKTAIVFLDTYIGASNQNSDPAAVSTEYASSGVDKGYYWLTIQGGKDMARAIAKVLSEIDSVHKVSYLDAAYTVVYQLDEVYGSIKDKIYNLHVAPVIAWGDGWQGIVEEYEGKIKKTIDIAQSSQEQEEDIKQIAQDLKNNARTIVIGDMSFPFDNLKSIYRDGGRRVVILDPWGDFSDTWPYKVFVQQNLLRITQAL